MMPAEIVMWVAVGINIISIGLNLGSTRIARKMIDRMEKQS